MRAEAESIVPSAREPWTVPNVATLCLAIAAAVVFASFVGWDPPALRHDWSPSLFRAPWWEIIIGSLGGWASGGIGAPAPYPTGYLLGIVLGFGKAIVGANAIELLLIFGIGLACSLGARALALRIGAGPLGATAAIGFVLFNPWVYNKLVAGHLYMILAYGATMWLLAELLAPRTRSLALIACVIFVFQQLQFFVLTLPVLIVVAVRRRQILPLATAVIIALPLAVGIFGNRSYLESIPLTLAWEINQSVRLTDAARLGGYFAGYGHHFFEHHGIAIGVVLLLAVAGVIRGWKNSRKLVIASAVSAATFLVLVSGVRGPLAAPFSWLVQHVPEVGLFRELYDLVAYVAVVYLVLCSLAVQRSVALSLLWCLSSSALLATWIFWPPSVYWVKSTSIPSPIVHAAENTRVAMLPAFQPLTYANRGSGPDPDAYARAGGITAINEYIPRFPASAALAEYSLHGRVQGLEALSVSEIVSRPWLRLDQDALRYQWPLPIDRRLVTPPRAGMRHLRPLPELSLIGVPRIGSLDNVQGAGNVFYGDALTARGPLVPSAWNQASAPWTISPQGRGVRADQGWVNATLAAAEEPDLGQAFGGVVTTKPGVQLKLRPGASVLVSVRGRLLSAAGAVVSGTTRGYAWVALPPGAQSVSCEGLCAVALEGTPPRGLPLNPPPQPSRAVPSRAITSWLATATIPPGPKEALRYNVTFSPHWHAFLDGTELTHFRIDTAVNGWLLPPRSHRGRLLVVNEVAAAQLILEVLGLVWIAFALTRASKSSNGARPKRSPVQIR